MKSCTICSAILPLLNPESVDYVRIGVDGELIGARTFDLCACCRARAEANPLAVREPLRRAFARGFN